MEILLLLLTLGLIAVVVVLTTYIKKTNALAKKVAALKMDLEEEVHKLRREINSTAARADQQAPEPPQAPPTALKTAASPPAPPLAARPQSQPPLPHKPVPPSRTREEWEALIGGQWLNRIGALALIFGIGFFLKYAFDNDWITEPVRVLIGVATGIGLLVGGAHAYKKELQIFAQGLIGAGIPVLYLSVYASFNFYHLVPQTVAFFLMAAVTVLAFSQAFKYDSLAVSVLGWAGGFLTPFLLSTGQANEVGLFTYIALLVAGLLTVLSRKADWVVLEPLTLGATYLVYLLWHLKFYTPDDLFVTVVFLSIFWGLFYGFDLSRTGRAALRYAVLRQIVAGFNAVFYFVGLYAIFNPQHRPWMGLIALSIGVVYLLAGLLIRRRRSENAMALAGDTLTAMALLVLATSLQFSGFKTVIFWGLEAAILVGCGLYWKRRHLWQAALGLFVLAFLKLLATEGVWSFSPIEQFALLQNLRALALAVLAAGLGASAVLFKRWGEKDSEPIREVLHYGWCALLFALCTIETNDYFRRLMAAADFTTAGLSFQRFMTLAAIWVAYSLPLVRYGLRLKALPMIFSGFATLFLGIGLAAGRGLAFVPIEQFVPLVNFRSMVLLLVLAAVWIQLRWMGAGRSNFAWMGPVIRVLQVVSALLILDLLSAETRDFFERSIFFSQQTAGTADDLKQLANIKQLALSGVWLAYSIVLMVLGIWRRKAELRLVALALFGFTIVKIFAYDLSFLDTLYRIFSFMGLGLILLAVSYLYQRYKTVIFPGTSGQEQVAGDRSGG